MEGECSSSLQMIDKNVETKIQNVANVNESKVGMMFESEKELFDYYTNYSKQLGFPVKIRSLAKRDDGTFECNSKNPFKPRPSIRTSYKAKVLVILCADRKLRLNTIMLDHNHEDSKTIQSGNVAESDGQYSNLPLYNNNLALLWGVTLRGHENQSYGMENYFMDSAAGFDEGFLNGLSGSEVYLTNINEGVLFGWSD
ncbi:unnamed protein product [Ilex paraguariensis]|uniref:Protein FAR1-RELATED SEQUENCE n=1 Tax=Ilex paraguariensis TaxID=185542 RepID=A0ABC8TIN1_9AQUA